LKILKLNVIVETPSIPLIGNLGLNFFSSDFLKPKFLLLFFLLSQSHFSSAPISVNMFLESTKQSSGNYDVTSNCWRHILPSKSTNSQHTWVKESFLVAFFQKKKPALLERKRSIKNNMLAFQQKLKKNLM